MVNNSFVNTFDYVSLIKTLRGIVKQFTGYQLIERESAGSPEHYPFFSYSFLNDHIDVTSDRTADGTFELVLSITCLDDDSLRVKTEANRLRAVFESYQVHELLAKRAVSVVDITSSGSRNAFKGLDDYYSINYERRAGFDMRLRVEEHADEEDVLGVIETIDLENQED
ncbi:hypothetical protein EQG49_12815 [Periweissella cryptocerci]|uniref:Phage neck terminator protein gp12-like domain-containing protein n=1 Tax=Periweissella cryptocerci TaxID=2506420 RepID=A0A4P6YWR2_9LACO|nr:hypothetical protein [Periweissella cryptocerci]QBO37278.1 hypothetical protein EQG49_12815 [Periweissella cryptocerci]